MLNNEMWLAHSDLFEKHWVWETKPWVRGLGWFSDFQIALASDRGWHLFGNDRPLGVNDYLDVVYPLDAEKKLYCRKNGMWEHLDGPVVFVYRKSPEELYIAGWAGEKKTIAALKKKNPDPWQWEKIYLVDVNPSSAILNKTTTPIDRLPVFFMSNGETNADINWARLKSVCPHAQRVDGINGRRLAFQRCAELTDKSHFFVVTGKNWVTKPEVFEYRPDETIGYKHSVFFAKNMSNDWVGGHMAIVLYNRETVLNTPENFGLDFTEWGGTVTVPILASEAQFATTPYEAWRTSFREAVKLTIRSLQDEESLSNSNLTRWLTYATGEHRQWVVAGAKAGHEYALQNLTDERALLNTVDWYWLKSYFQEFGQVTSI